jgi:hypothetical protein
MTRYGYATRNWGYFRPPTLAVTPRWMCSMMNCIDPVHVPMYTDLFYDLPGSWIAFNSMLNQLEQNDTLTICCSPNEFNVILHAVGARNLHVKYINIARNVM